MHLVWGLGKDFGLSGFRTGFLVSKSPLVRRAMEGDETHASLSWFGPLDSLKNVHVRLLFDSTTDGRWSPIELMEEYGAILTRTYNTVRAALVDARVPCLDMGWNNPAQFFVLDCAPTSPARPTPGCCPARHSPSPSPATSACATPPTAPRR